MIKQLGPSLRTQRKVGLFVVFYEGDFNSTTLLKDSWREKTCFSYRTFTLVLSEINSGNFVNEKVARCRGIWIPEPRAHIMLVESGILAVQLKQSGISLTMGIPNPNSTDKESGFQYLKSRILSVESRIQIVLDYLNYNGAKKVSYSDADVRYKLYLYLASQMLIKTMQRLSIPYKEI